MDAQIQGQDTEYKPWGITAGAMVGTRQADTDAANLLALQGSQLGNVVKQKDAYVAQGQMDNPKWLKQKLAGEIGQGQSLAAGGKVDEATADSKIKAKIAEHLSSASKSQVEQELSQVQQTSLGLAKLIAAGEATGYSGMQFEYGANEIAKQMGADPQMIQQFLKANPEGRSTMLKALKASADKTLTYTPQVMQKMAEQEQNNKTHGQYITEPQNASHERVAAGNNATTLKSMQMQIDAGRFEKKGQLTMIEQLIKTGKYESAATGLSLLAMQEQDPVAKQQLLQQASMYEQMAKEKAAAGAVKPSTPDIAAIAKVPGQTQTPSRISSGEQTPSGQTKSGVKFKVIN